ncbi:MAG: tetratricopeptide repeat protein [Anaerolineae bacterium]|nr:tetratricopeptide repeat protein [Anaerolineae bacterium]
MKRFVDWLGRERAILLFLLIAITGTASLILQAVEPGTSWVVPVQNGLMLLALAGAIGVPLSRLDPIDRQPLLVAVLPLLLGLALGIFLPQFMFWFLGAGVGWLIVSLVILRRNVRREYQQAIRYLRKEEYDTAIQIITRLVKAEPDDTRHYRFRADLYRLKGQPAEAIKDYRRIIKLEPDSSVGYNGLAEIHLQQGEYEAALEAARQAYDRAPEQWAMPYNLGMIEDRLRLAAETRQHLQEAVAAHPPDSRHRLLIRLWLARAALRLGDLEGARTEVEALRREKRGLQEWDTIFASEQSRSLQAVLAGDIALARALYEGAGVELLAEPEDAQ